MTRWLRDFRLMPVVLLAIICLFALKSYGVLFDGGYTLGQRLGSSGSLVVTTVPMAPVTQLRSPAVPLGTAASARSPKPSWMQEMFGYPGDVTGSIQTTKAAEKAAMEKAEAAAEAAKPAPQDPPAEGKTSAGTAIPVEQPAVASAGERALLERLQERRKELDARARELDLRESLVKAAEKKLGGAAGASAEGGAEGAKPAGAAAGPATAPKDENDNPRFKSVVAMYETMKPKDAAKIFDRLDIRVLIDVASQMKPQIMAAILSQMSPEAAERLTVELASKGGDRAFNPSNLPKIDGRPGGS
jgi:flagellar motility protein MotE (MotC chaperone)